VFFFVYLTLSLIGFTLLVLLPLVVDFTISRWFTIAVVEN
jgi:hypothetical protein